MNKKHTTVWLLGAFAAAALTACGGGGGEATAPTPAPAPAPTAVRISGKAVDGPLGGARACYDLNDNNACDAGEPTSAPTGADGTFSFEVDAAVAGKHRVVVEVPATAVDADTGAPVGTAFTLLSPATGSAGAQTVFASPLTTLVQAHMDATGATLSAASELIQTQAGLTISPLADFTADGGNPQAANTARLVQLTTIKQGEALAAIVGTVDLSGATISAADLGKTITQATIAALPTVAATVTDPAIAGKSGAELTAALKAAAQTVATDITPTAEEAKAAIGTAKLPADTTPAAATEGATLSMLRWTDPNVWYYRTLEASAADNTADADNKVRYYEVHRSSESSGFSPNGVIYTWARGNVRQRAGDLHWNGSAWVSCPLGEHNVSTKRDAAGNSAYDYCQGYEAGTSTRAAMDIAGQPMATVIAEKIRTLPGGASGIAYANFGPADLSILGSATFPAGSKLLYQSNTVTKTAIAYDVQASNVVFAQVASVAAGGDARANPGIACAAATLPAATTVTTLEDLVARNPGTPCIFGKNVVGTDSSLDPNEWWSNATASLGQLNGAATRPAGTGNWYSADLRLRVAFAATGNGNGTTYYSCLSRATNGSSRNCTAIGSGTYAIETLGDARVMSFTGLPAITQKTGFTRVFVEREGKVWFGFRNPVGGTTPLVRMNLEATNGLFAALPGVPQVRPVTRYADMSAASKAALATMTGVWGFATDSQAFVLRFGPEGRFVLGDAAPEDTFTREQSGNEVGWFDYDAATKKFRSLVEVDSDMTAGTSHPAGTDLEATLTVTPTALTLAGPNGGGRDFTRLANDPNGIVGMWARSATEMKTQQFVFFPNGRVLMIDPIGDTSGGACTAARQGPPGSEFAQYTYDAATGAVRIFGKIYDTNGCAGFFDSSLGAVQAGTANTEVNFTFVPSADGKSASITVSGQAPQTVQRIAVQ